MERSVRLLRFSIVAMWFFIIASIVSGFYEEKYLPEVLKNYLSEKANEPLTQTFIIVFCLVLLITICLIVSSVGVYLLKPWARTSYIASSISITLICLFMGPSIISPVETIFQYLANAAEGCIIAMLFFSPAYERFERSAIS